MEMEEQRRSRTQHDQELLAHWRMHLAIARQLNPGYREFIDFHAFSPRKRFKDKWRVPSDDDEEAILEAEQSLTLTIPILQARTSLMAKEYYDSNGLKAALPSTMGGPTSNYGFYCWRRDGAFCFHNFHATYAAKKFLDIIMQGASFKWINDHTILTDNGLKIRAEYHCSLEEVIEYEYKGKEGSFTFPCPYDRIFDQFAGVTTTPTVTQSIPASIPTKERAPSEPRPDGLIPLADIVAELNIEPRDARQILRKSELEKPSYGWAWARGEVDKIKKLLRGKAT